MKTATDSQILRSDLRDSSGRMLKHSCECCGKGAPMAYYSEEDVHGNMWMVLCLKCAKKIAAR